MRVCAEGRGGRGGWRTPFPAPTKSPHERVNPGATLTGESPGGAHPPSPPFPGCREGPRRDESGLSRPVVEPPSAHVPP